MEKFEKDILRTACSNLQRATIIPRNFNSLTEYEEWIRNANRAAIDFVNLVNTLTKEENKETKETKDTLSL